MKGAAIALLLAISAPKPGDDVDRGKLAQRAGSLLPDPGDAAAVLDLGTGEAILEHHPAVLERRMLAGSVMKLATAYAILEAKRADETYRCTGEHVDRFGVRRACWLKGGHGDMRLHTAIASSCNAWFYEQATHLDPDALISAMTLLGLDPPKMPLLSERELPDAAVGDLFGLEVTPRALLDMASAIARRAPPGRAEWLEALAEGMAEATRSGTLSEAFQGLDVAAKTGTAKRTKGSGKTRGIVLGFLPKHAPRYAFVVVKDRGRGAIDAGPPARELASMILGTGAAR
jgi:cell division protein FtsI/penicillin-binding protein 2